MDEVMTRQKTTIREVFPYLRLRRAKEAIEFYKKAFGAEELFRLTEPTGRIGHAELRIGPITSASPSRLSNLYEALAAVRLGKTSTLAARLSGP